MPTDLLVVIALIAVVTGLIVGALAREARARDNDN